MFRILSRKNATRGPILLLDTWFPILTRVSFFWLEQIQSNLTVLRSLVMEDSALNYSVSEIESFFNEALKMAHNKLDDNLARPVTSDITVFHHFKSVAKGLIAHTLLRKSC